MLSVLGKITLKMKFGEGCIVYHETNMNMHVQGMNLSLQNLADLLEKLHRGAPESTADSVAGHRSEAVGKIE